MRDIDSSFDPSSCGLEEGLRVVITRAFVLRLRREGGGQILVSETKEHGLMAGVVVRSGVQPQPISAITQRHAKTGINGERAVPVFERFDKSSHRVQLICQIGRIWQRRSGLSSSKEIGRASC